MLINVKFLTLLEVVVLEIGVDSTEEESLVLVFKVKIDNMKFRAKIWDDKNSNPKHSSPNVSAVSCTTRRTFRECACCHSVSDKGAFRVVDKYEKE